MATLTEMSLNISWVQALLWFAIYCLLSGVRAFRFWLLVGKQHFKLVFRAIGIQKWLESNSTVSVGRTHLTHLALAKHDAHNDPNPLQPTLGQNH